MLSKIPSLGCNLLWTEALAPNHVKKKKKTKQSKHLFGAQSLESAADAFKGSATAAELTNMHIQRMWEEDCLHGMKAWRCVWMIDGPKRQAGGREGGARAVGHKRFIMTNAVGGPHWEEEGTGRRDWWSC